MRFKIKAVGSDKHVIVRDLLSKNPKPDERPCTVSKEEEFEVTSSGSDNDAGLVQIDASRSKSNYKTIYQRLDVHEGEDPIELNDEIVPASRRGKQPAPPTA
jgi:hypothetical protein